MLPATLAIVDRSFLGRRIPEPVPVHTWLEPLMRHPRFVALAAVACTLALAGGLHELDYDHNLLNLQPDGLESVQVEKKLLEECDQSVWYALSIADSREQLLERKARLEALPSVERIDEIASLLPGDEDLKRPAIERIGGRLATLPERPPEIPVDRLDALGETLAWAQGEASKRPGGLRTAWHLERVRESLRTKGPDECYRALAAFQQRAAAPQPTSLLPPGITADPLSDRGRHQLEEDLQLLTSTAGLPAGFPPQARVLIVEGGEDQIVVPEARHLLRNALPTADTLVLAGVGHCLLSPALDPLVCGWIEGLP